MTRGAIALLMAGALGCSRGGESRCAKFRAEPVRSLGNPEPSAVGGNTTAAGSAPVPSFRGPELLAPLGAVGYANPGPPGLSQHRSAASRLRVCDKFRAEVAAELELEAREAIEAAIAEVRPGQQYLAAEEMMS